MDPLQAIYEAAAEHVKSETGALGTVNATGHQVVDTPDDGDRITYAVTVASEGDTHYTVFVVATVDTWRKIEVDKMNT